MSALSIGDELAAITDVMMLEGMKGNAPEIVAARKAHLQSIVDTAPSSDTKGRGDDFRAHAMFPTTKMTDADGWVPFFDGRPDALHTLIGDIYRIVKAHEPAVRKTGRRPRSINGNMQELWEMISPRFSQEPFAEAVKELMGTTSLRAFAAKIPMAHYSLTRLMTGERAIVKVNDPKGSMALLESIAKAGKVHPSYFCEWRELYVWSVLQEVLTAKPNLSISLVKQINRARDGR
jgi:hypothetical protein